MQTAAVFRLSYQKRKQYEDDGSILSCRMPSLLERRTDRLEHAGRTTMIVRLGDKYPGVLGVMDTPRESASTTVAQLRELGIDRVIMISGDNQIVANAVAQDGRRHGSGRFRRGFGNRMSP